MAKPDADEIDFKPFFDMIVGVLFVLLILIAAQMFFSQWGGSPDAQASQQRRHFAWNRQISAFLEDLAARLKARGLPVVVDREARALTLPLEALAAAEAEGRPRVRSDATLTLGSVLSERLRCLPGQSERERAADCPATDLLRLGRVASEVRLDGAPSAGLAPERYGRLVSTLLNAALVQTAPDLLAITGAGGVSALAAAGEVSIGPTVAKANEVNGAFSVRFVFDEP